jgi:hypothetical protein
MFSLILDVSRWVIRRFVWFLFILAILWAGWLVKSQFNDLADMESSLLYLKNGQANLHKDLKALEKQTEDSVSKFKSATLVQIDQGISELSQKIDSKNNKLAELDSVLNKLNPAIQLDIAWVKLEIVVATQAIEYLRLLKEFRFRESEVKRISSDCESIRLNHVAEWNAYLAGVAKLNSFLASASVNAEWNPLSAEFSTRETLESERDGHANNTQTSKTKYEKCQTSLQAAAKRVIDGVANAKEFAINHPKTQAVLTELQGKTKAIQDELDKHWLKPILIEPLRQIFPIALGILATAIFVPLAIKLVLFFVLAPLAARRSSICLLPHASAKSQGANSETKSTVSLSVEIPPGSELLILPQYFHSAPDRCKTSSRYLLNKNYTMTSLAAGMYNLTAVQADETFVATVSSGQESLSELTQIQVKDGEAICLRPRNLVGVIHNRSDQIKISSHWRLSSLQAWLTMQLRYLVFHGPATIIVKGCRGVRIEAAIDGRSIEQISTIGFSANLNYSTSRTETVMAYLSGKKGLLRDRFSGSAGFYIYEEMPDPSKRSGITGKGIEGISDAVLKLFGV